MPAIVLFLIIIFVVWNAFVCFLFGLDKFFSKMDDGPRIRESTLLVCAAMFGAIGALIGMAAFHHKVRNRQFRSSIPAFLCTQFFIVLLIVFFMQMLSTPQI